MHARVAITAIVACVAADLLKGYWNSVINTPKKHIEAFYMDVYTERAQSDGAVPRSMKDVEWLFSTCTVSIFYVTGFFGCLVAFPLLDRLGRRLTLILTSINAFIMCILYAICQRVR